MHDVAGFALVDYDDADHFLLMRGGRMLFRFDPLDSEGRRLFGYGSAEYTTDGSLALSSVADTAPAMGTAAAFQYNSPEQVDVTADHTLEVSTVEARSGDGALAFEVEVVDASAVSSVVVVDDPPPGVGRSAIARAYDATGEQIHSPDCVWEIYPEELRLDWRIDTTRSSVRVDVSLPEIVTATCTINGVSSSISL